MKVKSRTVPASPALGSPANIPDFAELPSVRLLGIRIDCLRLRALLDLVSLAAVRRVQLDVLYVNVHCMNVARRDREYAAILDSADMVYCDGTGVRLGARLARLPIPERMTGADWIHDLCRLAVRDNLALYFLGGSPGSAREAAELLTIRYPGLQVAGAASGYGLGRETLLAIEHASPDILLVGMGTPTQEKWIACHRADLDVPVIWAVGALFDFVNGRIPRGPRWLTEHGFEWLCRLAVEPGKLWRRYLIGNPWFIWRVIRHYWLQPRP
jgi:N-acetylglucosaminyldiphosphoundecaprenol N-acetyl-beta-D-mannosaminyltransferase